MSTAGETRPNPSDLVGDERIMRAFHSLLILAWLAVTSSVTARADDLMTKAQRAWLGQISQHLTAQGFKVHSVRVDATGYSLEIEYRGNLSAGRSTHSTSPARRAR
jgi:hypothetical protein